MPDNSLTCSACYQRFITYVSHLNKSTPTFGKLMSMEGVKNRFTLKLIKLIYLHWLDGHYDMIRLRKFTLLIPIISITATKKDVEVSGGTGSTSDVHKYPSSKHMYSDWDKLAKQLQDEEKTENLEGDAALNRLFQQIYSDGSDEVKRAMNKSFQESGGTVLSTNWKDIKKEKVEVKPPDCMEYKKYEY